MKAEIRRKGTVNFHGELIRRMSNMPQIALGFPKGPATSAQYPDGTSVIDVAFYNNFGTRKKDGSVNIPARRFMDIGGRRASIELKGKIEKMIQAVNANQMTLEQGCEAIGQKAVAIMKDTVTDLREPPNAPATIAAKKSDNPLIDTEILRSTITFDIRNKKVKQ